jgi:hypothetical protein
MRAFASAMALDEDNFSPKTPVGVDAEESLANSVEDGQVKDGIWSQLPKLNAIGKKKASKKFVDWKGQPTTQKRREHDCETSGRFWARIRTWEDNI